MQRKSNFNEDNDSQNYKKEDNYNKHNNNDGNCKFNLTVLNLTLLSNV